jgi:hypothetical protein
LLDLTDYEAEEEEPVGNDLGGKENFNPTIATPNSSTPSKGGDNFCDASKRPIVRGRKKISWI